MSTPIGVALAELAALDPSAPAVTDPRGSITRAELESRTNRLARAYAELGVRQGDYVTIGLPNGIEFVEAVIATWKLGATPQPLSHRLPARELTAILALVSPRLVVGIAADTAGVPAGFTPDESLSDAPLSAAIAPSLKAPTSGGSTGVPKVIVSTEEGAAESLTALAPVVRVDAESVVLCTGPLSHNGPFLMSLVGLVSGAHLVVMDRFDAVQALADIQRHRVTFMYSVPTMLHRFAKLDAEVRASYDVSSLKTVVTMAAMCPQWLKERSVAWLGPDRLIEIYAATEAHVVTLIDGHGWLAHPGSVGRPVIGELKICEPDGSPTATGQTGEVWMRRGPGVSGPYRYLGATARSESDGWESVGDLGRLDVDGFLYLGERVGDMIVVGGSNVYPAEVEAALEEHPAVLTSCVIGIDDDEYGKVLHAIVQTDSAMDADELTAHLRERVVPYKIPRTFDFTTESLRDDAGKLRRSLFANRIPTGHSASERISR